MKNSERVALYVKGLLHTHSGGFARLTPAQRRRVRKHDNRIFGGREKR